MLMALLSNQNHNGRLFPFSYSLRMHHQRIWFRIIEFADNFSDYGHQDGFQIVNWSEGKWFDECSSHQRFSSNQLGRNHFMGRIDLKWRVVNQEHWNFFFANYLKQHSVSWPQNRDSSGGETVLCQKFDLNFLVLFTLPDYYLTI